jgi:hypothetical protein
MLLLPLWAGPLPINMAVIGLIDHVEILPGVS